MFKIKDLNIEDDILPIFNYTNNENSESLILEILKKPLPELGVALERQHILKGFISNSDSLQSGYSHFMNEVQNVKAVTIEAATSKRCFAVFDELFKGTNIDDAQDISLTTIKGLTRFTNSYFFISTHLLQMEELLEEVEENIMKLYVDCELVNGTPKFNYTIKSGWSSLRIGKILFNLEGLSELLEKR